MWVMLKRKAELLSRFLNYKLFLRLLQIIYYTAEQMKSDEDVGKWRVESSLNAPRDL